MDGSVLPVEEIPSEIPLRRRERGGAGERGGGVSAGTAAVA